MEMLFVSKNLGLPDCDSASVAVRVSSGLSISVFG